MATETINLRLKLLNLIRKGKRAIWHFNLFESVPPSQDESILRQQRLSTSLFIILFVVFLIILTIYTSQVTALQSITINNPSYSLYMQLYTQYPNTLTCPCTRISVPYKNYVQLNASYHEVCTSSFVEDKWINLLLSSQITIFASTEFRFTGPAFFQALASFCRLTQKLIENELNNFANTLFITADVMPEDLFMEQILATTDSFISHMETNFMNLISSSQLLTNANGLTSGFFTNFDYNVMPVYGNYLQAAPTAHIFPDSNCACFQGNKCKSPVVITSTGN